MDCRESRVFLDWAPFELAGQLRRLGVSYPGTRRKPGAWRSKGHQPQTRLLPIHVGLRVSPEAHQSSFLAKPPSPVPSSYPHTPRKSVLQSASCADKKHIIFLLRFPTRILPSYYFHISILFSADFRRCRLFLYDRNGVL